MVAAATGRGDGLRLLAALALAVAAGACCGAAVGRLSTAVQLAAASHSTAVRPTVALAPTTALPLSPEDFRDEAGDRYGEPWEWTAGVPELPHFQPQNEAEVEPQMPRVVVGGTATEVARWSTPALLAAVLMAVVAAAAAAAAGRSLRRRADPGLAGRWATMSYGGGACRPSLTLAAGRDDFDRGLLSGSGWDDGPLSRPTGLAKSIDDVPPTDNSGFQQAGGFGWNDLEGGYDHIGRRMQQRREQQVLQMAEKEKETRQAVVQQVTERRAARVPPRPEDPPQAVLDYLLNTITDDLAFEITRVRPLITDAFYAHVDGLIEAERQKEAAAVAEAGKPPVTMLRNYEVLKKLIEVTFRNIDAAAAILTAPKDRLKKLLSAQDKKAMILEMVAANEVDEDLLVLLKTNQADAQVAGAQQVADYLGKLHDECRRFANLTK